MANTKVVLLDIVTELLARASEDQLTRIYYELRPASPVPRPYFEIEPQTTKEAVERALMRASHPAQFREIVELVRIERPDLSEGSISGMLSKLQDQGRVERRGPKGQSVYRLAAPKSS